ncbi:MULTISPECIES: hypothetical protein [Listeria]|uniref:Uncharacterized protein n=1 Tax=Listeria riparia FSL S10-1204 TaxID=1265816 RepID=W7D1A9_9LIST|nr:MULTISPECIES: hypothetical protein [Listeria]EUJ42927.1 hypothetical protein PRIP_14777 [Listeria riparia FSL S10-1204]MBC2164644.1 hypothetical protein [Listeria booriae]
MSKLSGSQNRCLANMIEVYQYFKEHSVYEYEKTHPFETTIYSLAGIDFESPDGSDATAEKIFYEFSEKEQIQVIQKFADWALEQEEAE